MLSDAALLELQRLLVQWIKARPSVGFHSARKIIVNIAISLGVDVADLGSYPEYKVLFPLYQVGIVEYGVIDGIARMRLCRSCIDLPDGKWLYEPGSRSPRYSFIKTEHRNGCNNEKQAEELLKGFPSLMSCVLKWPLSKVMNLHYVYDCFKHSYTYSESLAVYEGIAKQVDKPWVSAYFRIKDNDYLIPQEGINPEALRIARSFMLSIRKYRLFSRKNDILYCHRYSELPVPVVRALMLASPESLADSSVYKYNYEMSFHNISDDIIRQLERIFSTRIGELQ